MQAIPLLVALLAGRGTEFLPELNEGALYLTFTLPANTSLTDGRRQVALLDYLLNIRPQIVAPTIIEAAHGSPARHTF